MPTLLCISGCIWAKETLIYSLPRQIWGMIQGQEHLSFTPSPKQLASSVLAFCVLNGSHRQVHWTRLAAEDTCGVLQEELLNPTPIGSIHTSNTFQKNFLEKSPLNSIFSSHYITWGVDNIKELISGYFLQNGYLDLSSHLGSLSFESWCFKSNLIEHLAPILNSSNSTYEISITLILKSNKIGLERKIISQSYS